MEMSSNTKDSLDTAIGHLTEIANRDPEQLHCMCIALLRIKERMNDVKAEAEKNQKLDLTDYYVAVLMAADDFATDKAKKRKKQLRHIL